LLYLTFDIVRADVRGLLVLRASSDPRAPRQDEKSDWHDLALFHKSVEEYKRILCVGILLILSWLQGFDVDGAEESFDCNQY
jgi:hypothetical protein